MIQFNIEKPNDDVRSYLQDKIDNLTKPKGALGILEDLAMQVGWVQQSLNPKLTHPCHIVFAGDHGIAAEGVSPSPQEVTQQMVLNFLDGGAGINFLARQHNIHLTIVDSGVNGEFEDEQVVNKKIRKSTRNYLHESAMTSEELEQALQAGADCVQTCFEEGCNIISFGEMGITNTSSSALWMTHMTGADLKDCVGAGCDHTGSILEHKYNVLKQCSENYKGENSALAIMQHFGGYEMVMAVGAMLKAAELKMLILVDGFIMTNCLLMAKHLNEYVIHYAIFGHKGDEAGHRILLEHLQTQPILNLGFRLGEGTGALCAFPIVDSAVRMINEMNSFKQIQVSKYF